LYYAAIDAYVALLLYENQIDRGLIGGHRRKPVDPSQAELPLDDLVEADNGSTQPVRSAGDLPERTLSDLSLALLGIVTELPTRYSPDALAASVSTGRIGMAGWIIDTRLGADADPDEESVKLTIADLCAQRLVRINETRRLLATDEGIKWWRKYRGD
jgi:hypothetical protein